ncbi:MAG: flagellar basal body rod protein FlgB [Calditrichia bacterium]
MIKNLIIKNTSLPAIQKGLNAYARREKAISSNIANVNTPGYKRLKVEFEETFQNKLNATLSGVRTHENHIPLGRRNGDTVEPTITMDNTGDLASGVNNVDIENEMVELVKNQIRYMYGTRMAAREFSAIRASIKGRFDR